MADFTTNLYFIIDISDGVRAVWGWGYRSFQRLWMSYKQGHTNLMT